MMDDPDWRSIKERPDYEVSRTGEVRRRFRKLKGLRVLKPVRASTGYSQVSLGDGSRTRLVHRLVAEAFLGDAPFPDAEVNHINGIKHDNRVENLEWCTKSGNAVHAHATGLTNPPRGERHWKSRLTETQVRDLRSSNERAVDAAARLGISKWTVWQIRRGRSWAGVAP